MSCCNIFLDGNGVQEGDWGIEETEGIGIIN
jgi:hypothetical protein